jgi:hypothetical protein
MAESRSIPHTRMLATAAGVIEQSCASSTNEDAGVAKCSLPGRQFLDSLGLQPDGCVHSLRWFVSLCRVILVAAIGHMPMVRAEVPLGGPIGASARCKIPILLGLAWALC